MLYWGVKFSEDKEIVGLQQFPQDQMVYYRGLYGIPSYVIWYMAADKKTSWLDIGDAFEIFIYSKNRIYLGLGRGWKYAKPNMSDVMIVTNIVFDVELQMFKLTAVSHFWYILSHSKQIPAMDVGTKDNPASGIEVIEKLVKMANQDQFIMAATDGSGTEGEIEGKGAISKIKYISINEDPEVSVLDKIADICLENFWEWYIGKGTIEGKTYNVIYIADKLRVKGKFILPFEPEEGHRQVLQTSSFTVITTESVWCEPMLSYGKPARGRALWVKFFLGNEGGLMTVMMQNFTPSKKDPKLNTLKFLTENEFIGTLHKGLCREYGIRRLYKYPIRNYPVLIGKMFGEQTDENRDEYSASRWSGDPTINTRDINKKIFKTEWPDKNRPPKNYLENRKITTPFAGDGVGLLFPQTDGHKTILAPDGMRDSALIGPGYFGPEDQVPVRASEKDFRLQLSDKWALIVKENGDTILQTTNADAQSIIDDLNASELGMEFIVDNGSGKREISFGVDGTTYINLVEGPDGQNQFTSEGKISIFADFGNIDIASAGGDITILTQGKIKVTAPSIELVGENITINGVTISRSGSIVCTTITAGGMTIPPKIPV